MTSERSSFRRWSSLAVALLALGAGTARTQDLADDRRLDVPLRLLHRAQSGQPAGLQSVGPASPGRTREFLERMRAGTWRRRALRPGAETEALEPSAPRLTLLVKFGGRAGSLEGAGFRVQAQVGRVYTGSLDPSDLDGLLALREVVLVQLSREIAAPRPSPTVELGRSQGLPSPGGGAHFNGVSLASDGRGRALSLPSWTRAWTCSTRTSGRPTGRRGSATSWTSQSRGHRRGRGARRARAVRRDALHGSRDRRGLAAPALSGRGHHGARDARPLGRRRGTTPRSPGLAPGGGPASW